MIDRKELKAKGKAAFTANYWKCVLVAFILTLITGATVTTSYKTTTTNATEATNTESISELSEAAKANPEVIAVVLGVIFTIILIIIIASSVIDIFLTNPLEMGCRSFFLKNSDDPNASLDEIKNGFQPNYFRNVKAMFLKDLYIFLWALLLVVPGIIKGYAYSLVPYILAEDPDITPSDALKKSEEMMMGHKKEAFVLDMSFFLWGLLAVVTFGIAQVLYVGPYVKATDVELYKAIKASYEDPQEFTEA
ncbi:MAG: DUF975 family protein [Erysipelotrichaceae bacterium]|nr:DUF975 family protein [Erysipelotrichaceae bacterium]